MEAIYGERGREREIERLEDPSSWKEFMVTERGRGGGERERIMET